MNAAPTTLKEIQELVRLQVPEDLHLDYKASAALVPAKFDELAKDVSAFANSDGGVLVFGVSELNNLPQPPDSGVDTSVITRERVEQVLMSRIAPRVDGLRIFEISVGTNRSIFAIEVPKSFSGPHQANKMYYKRYNFVSVPMEHYEIEDVRSRRRVVGSYVRVDVEADGILAKFVVSNVGERPVSNIRFEISQEIGWMDRRVPKIFTRGIKYLSPGRRISVIYNSFHELLHGVSVRLEKFAATDTKPAPAFDIEVTYLHPTTNADFTEVFHFDFMDYYDTAIDDSDPREVSRKIEHCFDKLTRTVENLERTIGDFRGLAGATGLNISFPSMQRLAEIQGASPAVRKINPKYVRPQVFEEVLGVDEVVAHDIARHFYGDSRFPELKDIPGVSLEILELIQKYFAEGEKPKPRT